MVETLRQYYEEYDAKATEVRKKSSFFANFFGTGESANRHPCHEAFYEKVEAKMKEFVDSQPDPAAAAEVCTFLLEAPIPYKENEKDSYWFMYVCVGMIRSLVPFLTQEDCVALSEKMGVLYKKKDRMPVQAEAYKMLCKKAKGK